MNHFPEGFLWGSATAAHQVEGGNWNNDWWAWEHDPDGPCTEPSGDACDHFHRYPEDLRRLADLGFSAYRFSVEWSRIEPEEGERSLSALEHYRRMCVVCRELGLEPVVTLHHFTTPRWLAALGGWQEARTAERFARFAGWVAAHLGDLVGRYCTINEPNIVATLGYQAGLFPPGIRDPEVRIRANDVFIDAHRRASEAVKEVAPGALVGLTLSMSEHEALPGGESMLKAMRRPMEDVFLEAARGDDFLGVQVYTRTLVGPGGQHLAEEGAELTQMGYEYRPQALEACLRRAAAVTGSVPLLVTESGIATADDARRIDFVREALRGVLRCIDDGLDVRGYFYWSALDNFEWVFGYAPTFGLIAVDRTTQERTTKPSARWLGAVARANGGTALGP